MDHLELLPLELKAMIAAFVDDAAYPQDQNVIPQVSLAAGTYAVTKTCPSLKSLSAVNRSWRQVLGDKLRSRVRIKAVCDSTTDKHLVSTGFPFNLSSGAAPSLIRQPERVQYLTVDLSWGEPSDPSCPEWLPMGMFWRRLFDAFDPLRLRITAPITLLNHIFGGVHTRRQARTERSPLADSWVFPDMQMQSIELVQREHTEAALRAFEWTMHTDTHSYCDPATIFKARTWEEMRFFEGSSLQAYSTYEYHNLRVPSILKEICWDYGTEIQAVKVAVLFPFSEHILGKPMISLIRFNWERFRSIHFHFTPAPREHVLDDRQLVGKSDLADCWREVEDIYRRFVDPRALFLRDRGQLREFSTNDYGTPSIREILDEGFRQYVHIGWRQSGWGRWTRDVEDDDGDSRRPSQGS